MTAPDVADPELEEVAWDLDPLLDGARAIPARPSTRCSPPRRSAPTRSPSATPARSPSSTAPASPRRCTSSASSRSSSAAPAPTPTCYFSTDTADPARGALLQRVQEKAHADRDQAAVLRARVGGARRRARRRAARHRRARTSAATTCATARRYRPHLLSEPEEKILAEKALTGRTAWGRLFEEQTAAITGRRSRTAPSRSRSRSRSRACTPPTAPSARTPPSA